MFIKENIMKDVSSVLALKKDISKVLYDKIEEFGLESGMSIDMFYFPELEIKVSEQHIKLGIGLSVSLKGGKDKV